MREVMPVLVRGTTYASAKACAEALGVSVDTVYCAISRRDPDSIGLGRGQRPPASRKGGQPRKPIIVAGRKFASIAELARAIGRGPRDVRASLHRGDDAQANIVRAVMALDAAQENFRMRDSMKVDDGTLAEIDVDTADD